MNHSTCTHPATKAARAKCRKAREAGTAPVAPLLAAAPTTTLGAHMTPDQALIVGNDLIREHHLDIAGWKITFDNARRRAGCCRYHLRELSLSRPLMAQRSYDDTYETITHELAHALTPGHDHDEVWAAKHRELGGRGHRTFSHTDETAPWIGTCEHGKTFTKYRAPKTGATYRCRCTRGGTPVTWVKNR
jgi:predicted SprT family Zn-dependent metalloprotease